MVWCHEKKIIFIHIPKTGGSTIEFSLNLRKSENGYGVKEFESYEKKKAYQHFTWNDYKLKLGKEIYNEYFKFAIVRHPITRLISDYYWAPYGSKMCSFNDFLKKAENVIKNKLYNENIYYDHFQSQSSYIYAKNNNCKVDKIFRFEKFDEVASYIRNLLNEKDKEIKSKNVCKKKNKLSFKPTIKQMLIILSF